MEEDSIATKTIDFLNKRLSEDSFLSRFNSIINKAKDIGTSVIGSVASVPGDLADMVTGVSVEAPEGTLEASKRFQEKTKAVNLPKALVSAQQQSQAIGDESNRTFYEEQRADALQRGRTPEQAEKAVASLRQSQELAEGFGPSGLVSSVKAVQKAPTIFEGFKDLSTKLLEKLKGRAKVSKQFISDLTNAPDLKQPERDLIRRVIADEADDVDVTTFANKVKTELLPLDIKPIMGRYESVSLPLSERGQISKYAEHIYQSPIKTSAGSVHFTNDSFPSYFAHARVEEIAEPSSGFIGQGTGKPSTTRRVIEIQSDLFQKGRLESEMTKTEERFSGRYNFPESYGKSKVAERQAEIAKLEPYRNTWHERIIREEVKKAAQDGKTKLQFPTGETAMKIEGLGQQQTFRHVTFPEGGSFRPQGFVKPDELKLGMAVNDHHGNWIITDVLGDGKFKAVPKQVSTSAVGMEAEGAKGVSGMVDFNDFSKTQQKQIAESLSETFDISGKVDTNNPIYKFYEKEVGKYLKNKYKAQLITDAQGVKWWQVDLKPEYKKLPVEAFGALAIPSLGDKDKE